MAFWTASSFLAVDPLAVPPPFLALSLASGSGELIPSDEMPGSVGDACPDLACWLRSLLALVEVGLFLTGGSGSRPKNPNSENRSWPGSRAGGPLERNRLSWRSYPCPGRLRGTAGWNWHGVDDELAGQVLLPVGGFEDGDDLGIGRPQVGRLPDHIGQVERGRDLDVGIAEPTRDDLAELDLVVVLGGVEQDRSGAQDDRRQQLLLAAEDDDLGATGPRHVDQRGAFRVDDVEGEGIVLTGRRRDAVAIATAIESEGSSSSSSRFGSSSTRT